MSGTLRVNLTELKASLAAEEERMEKRPVPTAPWVMPLDLEDLRAFVEAVEALDGLFVEELNGRLCRMPDVEDGEFIDGPREGGTCDVCRRKWARVVKALQPFDFQGVHRGL